MAVSVLCVGLPLRRHLAALARSQFLAQASEKDAAVGEKAVIIGSVVYLEIRTACAGAGKDKGSSGQQWRPTGLEHARHCWQHVTAVWQGWNCSCSGRLFSPSEQKGQKGSLGDRADRVARAARPPPPSAVKTLLCIKGSLLS